MPKVIDCGKISKVLSALDEDEHDDIWGGKFDSRSSVFKESELSLYIQGCGRFTLPITKEAVQHLSSVNEDQTFMRMVGPTEVSNECNTIFIHGERVKLISNDPTEELMVEIISYVCKSMFGTEDTKVVNNFLKVHIDKLIIFHEKTDCKSSLVLNESESYPGICYTILLVIPTQNGFTGGRINVITKFKKIRRFDFEKDSKNEFSILILPAESRYEIEPVVKGSAIIAVLHLIWIDSFVANSSNPSLIKTIELYQNIKHLLLPWESPSLIELATGQEELAPVNQAHMEDSISTDRENSVENKMNIDDENRQLTEDEPEVKYLIFPLKGRYSIVNAVNISQLTGHDQLLAHILQYLEFIDLHLAVVSLSITTNDDRQSTSSLSDLESVSSKCVGVYQWIGLEDSFPQGTTHDFSDSSHVIGKAQHYLFEGHGVDGEILYYHYALVVQPRNQSIVLSCMHNFDRTLDCLEFRLWLLFRSARSKRSSKREQLQSDLMEVINFCSKEPVHVFVSEAPKTDERAMRMLKLCLHLRAEEETLALLALLGRQFSFESQDSFTKSQKSKVFFEGLRNEESSRIVADLEHRVVEWTSSAELILRLISPLRIFRQLNCFIKLAQHFFDRNRFEASRAVASRISEILSKVTSDHTNYLRLDHLKLYAPLIFSLELNPSTADEERLENYFALYRKLKFPIKSQILINLKDFQMSPTTSKVYGEMAEAALVESFTVEPFESGLPVIKIALSLTNENLQLRLIGRVSSERDITRRCALVNCILNILSPVDIANYSLPGLEAISNLLESAIENLKSQATTSYGHGTTLPANCQDTNFRNNLHILVRFIMLMENDERSANANLVTGIGSVLCSLPPICLCQLIQDLRASDGVVLRKLPRSYNLFFEICQMIGLKRREFIAVLPAPTIVELMESFIWLGDIHLAGDLVRQLNFEEPNNAWCQRDVRLLLTAITGAPDLWQLLVPASSLYASHTVNALLRTWMTSLIERLNELPVSQKELNQLRNLFIREAIDCLTLYVRNSLRFPEEANAKLDVVTSLLGLLSPVEISQTIVQIRNSNKVYWKIYEEIGKASKVYPAICAQLTLVDLHDLAQSPNEVLLSALMCTFSIENEEVLLQLVRKITSALSEDRENVLVAKLLASSEVRQLAEKSARNREALFLFIEHRTNWLRVSIDKWGSQKATLNQSTEPDELGDYQETAVKELEELLGFLANFQDFNGDVSLDIDFVKIEESDIKKETSETKVENQTKE